jgi:hypothetical protein
LPLAEEGDDGCVRAIDAVTQVREALSDSVRCGARWCGLSREIASDSQVKSPGSHLRRQNDENPAEMRGFLFAELS